MKIETINNEDEFLKLKDIWDNLALDPTIKFDWAYRWWKYFKNNNNKLSIVVAKDNDEIVGIAPLFIQKTQALKTISFNKISFLGDDLSDYLGFLIKQDINRETTFQALYKYIYNNLNFDSMEFNQINSSHQDFDLWQKYEELYDYNLSTAMKNHRIKFSE